MFLKDVPSPHTLSIDTSVCPATEGTSEPGLLAFSPSVLGFPLFSGTPASWGLELGGILHAAGVDVIELLVVGRIEEPVGVGSKDRVGEPFLVPVRVRKVCERRVDEDSIGVTRGGVHGGKLRGEARIAGSGAGVNRLPGRCR